ncbi:MAG TPA: hypothetical protein VHC40_07310 [Rhizomicrobium sp.]|nr:hypothetical protein [Rhizomicrobium sp.]
MRIYEGVIRIFIMARNKPPDHTANRQKHDRRYDAEFHPWIGERARLPGPIIPISISVAAVSVLVTGALVIFRHGWAVVPVAMAMRANVRIGITRKKLRCSLRGASSS